MRLNILIIAVLLFFLAGCQEERRESKPVQCHGLNMEHLNHLYADIELEDGTQAGIVHIYSEYPDYHYEIEPNEGYTCVDDVARAVVFLCGCDSAVDRENNSVVLDKMMNFILHMQAGNGYFHNFIWNDGSINRTYRTSLARPDWWSWRAFWAMESYALISEDNTAKISDASEKLAERIFSDLMTDERETTEMEGLNVPQWLPWESAADQAGVLMLALNMYYERTNDERAAKMIRQLAEGMLMMQAGGSGKFPYGAFISWNNLWHAYGNIQAFALMKAGSTLGEQEYIDRALVEVDNFYPWLISRDYLSNFSLSKEGNNYQVAQEQKFPQISYGFRPIVFAGIEAYRITGKRRYLNTAKQAASWYAGRNAAEEVMYDPSTGRCFDAVNDIDDINRNSGAESTIEALLALQAMTKAGITLEDLFDSDNEDQ